MRRLQRRFTLLEVLVSMSILVVLGTSLMLILRGGLQTWRRSEAKRESFDRAQAILLQLRDDFANLSAPTETPLPGVGETEARLVCIPDQNGLTQLFLVRSLKAEAEHPISGHAGSTIGADATLDQRDDLLEARQARLRATGGAMEVAWVLSPEGVLYRGIRSPIGPPESLFDPNGFELAPMLPKGAVPLKEGEEPPPATAASVGPALLRPFATEVIFFECLFWTQFTDAWEDPQNRAERIPALRDPGAGEVSGPLDYWDSTRALIRFDGADRREYHTFKSADSLDDPRDDVFPTAVQVTLVLREPLPAGSSTFLEADLASNGREVEVEDATRLPDSGYVYIGSEWIRYAGKSGDTLLVEARGCRGTVPAQHVIADEVAAGRTFTAVLDVTSWREDWSERRR